MNQLEKIGKMLQRKRGVTTMEVITEAGTTSPHRRFADLALRGWSIARNPIPGKKHYRYFGRPPKAV